MKHKTLINICIIIIAVAGVGIFFLYRVPVPNLGSNLGKEATGPVISNSLATTSTPTYTIPKEVYKSISHKFSIHYPTGYVVDRSYTYQAFGPGKNISGVKFSISTSTTSGTNLGTDSYVSVEFLPKALVPTATTSYGQTSTSACLATSFMDKNLSNGMIKNITDAGVAYSVASSSGVEAGNRYEETVYALSGTNPCFAVRYFVHYGVFENYPAGSIIHFDAQALNAQFDEIRRTLMVQK